MCLTSKRLLAGVFLVQAALYASTKHTNDMSKIVVDDQIDQEKISCIVPSSIQKDDASTVSKCGLSSAKHEIKPSSAGTKSKIFVKNDSDYVLSCGGKMKIDYFVDKSTTMLNRTLPDTLEYFKHCIDLNFDYAYGKEKFGYNATEAFIELRHKGVWGKGMSFADKDTGSTNAPSLVTIDNVSLGSHSHDTGRTLPWVKEAWLQFSPNAVLNSTSDKYLHLIKVGWIPFELGRGIALGGVYGGGKELLGLYSYSDDKATPGILIHGQIVEDKLSYDLYYSKIEERGRSFSGNIAPVRKHQIGIPAPYWRGDNRDNELFAGRIQGVVFDNEDCGKLNLEPYIFYNIADDQYTDINPDTNTKLGSFGLSLEHTYKAFEWGGEMAINFGEEKLHAIDKDTIVYKKDADGYVYGYHKYISTDNTYQTQAPADTTANAAAAVPYAVGYNDNLTNGIPGYENYYNGNKTDDRFRPAYTNQLRGWMAVVDGAYTFKKHDLKVSLAYAYASGDVNPHEVEEDKTYKGFIGLDEWYSGKRVPSVFLLDQRNTARPLSLTKNSESLASYSEQRYRLIDVDTDISFTDLQSVGGGFTWSPMLGSKKFSLNPNMLFFWRASDSKKVLLNANEDARVSTQNASKFMGTEVNTIVKCEILKDLTMYGNFAVFVPGQYYKDVAGIPLSGDLYNNFAQVLDESFDPKLFRLSYDTAYHLNAGFDYKF